MDKRTKYNLSEKGRLRIKMTNASAKHVAFRIKYRASAYGKYVAHKGRCKHTGMAFLLTFEQWWKIWQDSGHWEARGRKVGQYVMARDGDIGPYAVGNVSIILGRDNISAAQKGKSKKK